MAVSYLLLGTNYTAPRVGNAVPLFIASSVEVTVKDYRDNPLPYAKVELFDAKSGKRYTYLTDNNGVVRLPDRPITFGNWFIEVYKKDYTTGYIHYALLPFNFTTQTIRCAYSDRFLVTIELSTTPEWWEYFAKAVIDWLPEPIKTVAKWFGSAFGWLNRQLQNLIWNTFCWKVAEQSGGKITSCYYDPERQKVYITAVVQDPVPVIVIILIILACVAGAFVVGWTLTSYYGARVAEEQRKVEEIKKDIVDTLTKAREQNVITEETYRQAMENITQPTSSWLSGNLGWLNLGALMPLVAFIAVVVLFVTMFKVLRGRE